MKNDKDFTSRELWALESHKSVSRSYLIQSLEKAEPISTVHDQFKEGMITLLFTSKEEAFAEAEKLSSELKSEFRAERIKSLWDTVLDVSSLGFVGMILDNLHPISFFNRLSEVDRSRPSVACIDFSFASASPSISAPQKRLCFGPRGLIDSEEVNIIPWRNAHAADRRSLREVPLNSALPDSFDFHTIVDASGDPITVANHGTLLGPTWGHVGVVPVFSCRGAAEDYQSALPYQIRVAPLNVARLSGSIEDFLEQVRKKSFLLDVVLNPGRHRFYQGYFYRGHLRTLAGVFRITSCGFDRIDGILPAYDDAFGRIPQLLAVPGLRTVAKHPLQRILGTTTSPLTAAEAAEAAAEEIKRATPEVFEPAPFGPDSFALSAEDKIDPESLESELMPSDWCGPVLFSDIISACSWLANIILPRDFEVRTTGIESMLGWSEGKEDKSFAAKQVICCAKAIEDLMASVLREGYRPEHSIHLQRLFQDTSQTLEITAAGYLADFAFYGPPDSWAQYFDDEEDLNSGFGKQFRRLQQRIHTTPLLDENQVRDLRRYLGPSFDELSLDSAVILNTALEEFQSVGKRRGYDYAGITTKLCKVVERELLDRVFRQWRDVAREKHGKRGIQVLKEEVEKRSPDEAERLGLGYLEKKEKLSLGPMRILLSSTNLSSTPAISSLLDFLRNLQGCEWLKSEEVSSSLQSISSTYRNGGVHEYLVAYELCQEAFEFIKVFLGKLLLATRPRGSGH